MSARLFMVVVFAWILAMVIQGAWDGFLTGESDLATVLSWQVVHFQEFIFVPIPVPNFDFFQAAGNLLAWNFGMYSGNMQYGMYFFALLFAGGAVWGFWTNLMPVVISAASAVVSLINALNPFN